MIFLHVNRTTSHIHQLLLNRWWFHPAKRDPPRGSWQRQWGPITSFPCSFSGAVPASSTACALCTLSTPVCPQEACSFLSVASGTCSSGSEFSPPSSSSCFCRVSKTITLKCSGERIWGSTVGGGWGPESCNSRCPTPHHGESAGRVSGQRVLNRNLMLLSSATWWQTSILKDSDQNKVTSPSHYYF